jgi:hypothetical protein
LNLESVTEAVNDEHMQPWSEMCKVRRYPHLPPCTHTDRQREMHGRTGVCIRTDADTHTYTQKKERRHVDTHARTHGRAVTHTACATQKAGISTTPLSPYLDKELLYNNSLSIDGSKIERTTGFVYEVPRMTKEAVHDVIKSFQEAKLFPPVMLFK